MFVALLLLSAMVNGYTLVWSDKYQCMMTMDSCMIQMHANTACERIAENGDDLYQVDRVSDNCFMAPFWQQGVCCARGVPRSLASSGSVANAMANVETKKPVSNANWFTYGLAAVGLGFTLYGAGKFYTKA